MKKFIVTTVKNTIKLTVVLGIIFIVLLLTGIAHADDSQWCGIITEIYGVCSPELVQNYLSHMNAAAVIKTPPQEKAKLPGTDQGEDNRSEKGSISEPTSIVIPPETPGAPTQPPCWCAVDASRRCKISGEVVIVQAFSEDCEKILRRALGLPEPEPWFKNKIWMVS